MFTRPNFTLCKLQRKAVTDFTLLLFLLLMIVKLWVMWQDPNLFCSYAIIDQFGVKLQEAFH